MYKKIFFFIFLFSGVLLHAQEICNNGIDDDGDGLIDCYDPQCSGSSPCDSFFYNQPVVYCKYIPPVQTTFALDVLWTSVVTVDTRQTLSVGDINADGKPEVICFDNATNILQILNGQTGTLQSTITTPPINIQYDGPAIADTDGDGLGEIYVVTDDSLLRCYENNGTPKAGFTPAQTKGNREYIQSIADFNGDGIPEIYIGHEIFNSLTGALIATGGATASSGANGNNSAAYPVAADVLPPTFCADCAGLELICGNQVYSVNIGTGVMTLQRSAPVGLKDGYTSIADYNKDGKLDVIVSTKGDIYVWDPRTGLQIGTTYIIPGTTQGGHANLADYDGNGWPEIGVAGQNIFVALTDFSAGTGPNLKWSKVIVDGSGRTTCTSFDFEGDGQKEIIYRDENNLFVWDGTTGNVKASTPCGSGTRTEYPTIVDVDANGEANIVCTCAAANGQSSGVVKAFKSKTQPWVFTRKVMNQHTYFAVNINDDLSVPKTQQNHALVTSLNTFLNQPPLTDKNGTPIFIPAADVIVSIDTFNFSVCSNPNNVTVTLTFCDTGYVAAPKGMKVSFYNGDPLTGGTLILTDTTVNPIPAKGCITQTFTLPYSASLNLFVYANDKGSSPANAPQLTFIECDSTNNYDNKPITFVQTNPPTTSSTPVSCFGGNDGTAAVSATGGTPPYTYNWSNGQTTQNVSGLSAGTYTVGVTDSYCNSTGPELITNGNFNLGNTGFTSSYTFCPTGNCGHDTYVIGTNPANFFSAYCSCTDHTSGTGNMFIADGSIIAGTSFWCQTIPVTSNTNYNFSSWLTSIYTINFPNIELYINGVLLNSVTTSSTCCAWLPLSAIWNSGASTSANICLKNTNLIGGGNDFAMDDFSFRACTKCTSTKTVTITEPALVTATISGATTICPGASTTLTATGGGSYNWSTGDLTSAVTVTPSATSTYTVTVTNAGCTATTTAEVIVGVNLMPVITGNTTICNGTGTTLTTSGGGTYTWSDGSTNSSITVSPTTPTSYSVTMTNSSCSGTASVQVNVTANPTPTISGNTSVCTGTSTTLTATGGATYVWDNGATTTSVTVSPTSATTYTVTATTVTCTGATTVVVNINPPPNPTITGTTAICSGGSTTLTATAGGTYIWNTGETTSAISVSPTITTTYTVTFTSGCSATATVQVTIQTNLTPTITGTTTICNGTGTTLTTNGGGTYAWSDGNSGTSITVSPTIPTIYSVTVTNGSCSGTASVQVMVTPNPSPTITGTTTICNGSSTILTASGGGTYSWNTGQSLAAITVSPSGNITYTVIVTTNGCTGSMTAQVTVNPLPIPAISGTTTICPGQSTILTENGTAGPYIWSIGETTNAITVTPTGNTTYSVSVTQNNCTGTAMKVVTVIPPVIASITGNNICEGQSAILTASGGSNYVWSTTETINPITVAPVNTTTYTVIASVGTCIDTATFVVTVTPLPTATAKGDTTISYGNNAILTSTGGGTYNWTPPTGLSCTGCANPTATPTATTQYCVTVMVAGCTDSACVTVTIDTKCGDNGELYVPNGFSPNGDGQNDFLYVRGGGVKGIFWVIYDRWGEKVFETTDPKQSWDGTYKGKQLDAAVFVYYLKVTCFSGEEIIQKGNVAIIK